MACWMIRTFSLVKRCPKPTKVKYCNFNTNIRSLNDSAPLMMSSDLFFRQLFDGTSFTYTYLLADKNTKDAILIDPVIEQVNRDTQLLKELQFNLIYADYLNKERGKFKQANTHVHADHITGTGKLKEHIINCKSIISKASGAVADEYFEDGDILKIGNIELEIRSTPGHTNGCVTYVCHAHKMAFTGDALLIRGCGRTDFQQGDSERLYQSVQNRIFSLPDCYTLYPAHDYKGQTATTVEEEKKWNPRLTKSIEEFVEIMKNLNLAYPKMIDKAVPANMVCGIHDLLSDEKDIRR